MGGFTIMFGVFNVVFGLYENSIIMMATGVFLVWGGYRILDRQSKKTKGEETNAD